MSCVLRMYVGVYVRVRFVGGGRACTPHFKNPWWCGGGMCVYAWCRRKLKIRTRRNILRFLGGAPGVIIDVPKIGAKEKILGALRAKSDLKILKRTCKKRAHIEAG